MQTICLRCLEEEPHRRYATALELADDLRRYLLAWAYALCIEAARRDGHLRPAE